MGLSSLPVSSHSHPVTNPLPHFFTFRAPLHTDHCRPGPHSLCPFRRPQLLPWIPEATPTVCTAHATQPWPSGLPKSDLTSLHTKKPPVAPHCFRVKLTLLSLADGPFSPACLTPRHTQTWRCWKTSRSPNTSVTLPSLLSLCPGSQTLPQPSKLSSGLTFSEKSSQPD